ncbi:MAG TPA: AbrB/MazE/SpoVT family DNA-binding domain-containing protein [Thermoanaerobaculia bacterium]|nr:AbrB/MazE/SpoVT family DNA-binding domain-containing protein [Thermoanaerobaculia bacterium]
MRITSKGQVTIPQDIREKFGFLPDTEVEFIAKKGTVQLVKSQTPKRPTRGDALVRRLRGRAGSGMTTDEILALTRK